jgi:hypothetical protein
MTFKAMIAAAAMACGLAAGAASAATVSAEVFARENSTVGGVGYVTGVVLAIGQAFSITADPSDTWTQGVSTPSFTRTTNADGVPQGRTYRRYGQTFVLGSLVGRIGGGAFFLIGTSFAGIASQAGALELFHWDSNFEDNSGSITARIEIPQVAPVPLPAGGALLLAGLGGLALLRRRAAR